MKDHPGKTILFWLEDSFGFAFVFVCVFPIKTEAMVNDVAEN